MCLRHAFCNPVTKEDDWHALSSDTFELVALGIERSTLACTARANAQCIEYIYNLIYIFIIIYLKCRLHFKLTFGLLTLQNTEETWVQLDCTSFITCFQCQRQAISALLLAAGNCTNFWTDQGFNRICQIFQTILLLTCYNLHRQSTCVKRAPRYPPTAF